MTAKQISEQTTKLDRAYRNLRATCGHLRVACSQMTASASQILKLDRKSRKCHADENNVGRSLLELQIHDRWIICSNRFQMNPKSPSSARKSH